VPTSPGKGDTQKAGKEKAAAGGGVLKGGDRQGKKKHGAGLGTKLKKKSEKKDARAEQRGLKIFEGRGVWGGKGRDGREDVPMH